MKHVASVFIVSILFLFTAYGQETMQTTGVRVQATKSAIVNFQELAEREPHVVKEGVEQNHAMPLHDFFEEQTTGVPQSPKITLPLSFLGASPSPPPTLSYIALPDSSAGGFSYIPPDTHGGVGRDKVMVTLNSHYRIQDKFTSGALSTVSRESFWSSVASNTFDPRCIYDPYNDRWILTAVAQPQTASSSILVGISQTSNPLGSYYLFSIDADASDIAWADYPTLGFNKNWVAIAVNMFTNSGNNFTESRLLLIDYPNLRSGTLNATYVTGLTSSFTIQPCLTYSSTQDTLFAPEHIASSAATYRLNYITGTPASPTVTIGSTKVNPLGGWTAPSGNAAPQAPPLVGTGTGKIDVGGSRIMNAVYRNGGIYYAQTIGLPAGGTFTHTAAQWVQLDKNGNFVQGGRIEDPTATDNNGGKWYTYPSISVNSVNDIMVGFTQTASNQYASAGYAIRYATDPPNTMRDPYIFKAGEDYYFKDFGTGRNRWGDYSMTMIDPDDDLSFWTIQEYARLRVGTGSSSSRWGTWWAKVTICPSITISPSSLVNGTVGTPYSETFVASGGVSPYTFELAGGSLPSGISLAESGLMSGTPIEAGCFEFSILATDSNGCTETKTYQLMIGPAISALTFSSENLPPAGTYLTPSEQCDVVYENNWVLRNLIVEEISPQSAPPELGNNQTYNFSASVSFQLSTDGGTTFSDVSASASSVMYVDHTSNNGTEKIFETEMLSMNISGGTLPPGVLLRESPTRASIGKTTIDTSGQYVIESFFDIFIEISPDGGTTWHTTEMALRSQLDSKPISSPEVIVGSDSMPTHGRYLSLPDEVADYNNTIVIKDIDQRQLSPQTAPPALGGLQIITYSGPVVFNLSSDGGTTYSRMEAHSVVAVRVSHVYDKNTTHYFETELLQLDLTGGTLPPGFLVRESPTLASRGQTTIRPVAGGVMMSSFFDVFTEVTLNGGATWQPAKSSIRLQLDMKEPITPELFFSVDNLPPDGDYLSPPGDTTKYSNGIQVLNINHGNFTSSEPPPGLDSTTIYVFNGTVRMSVSTDGGTTFLPFDATASTSVSVTHISDNADGSNRFFETEMLSLNISGGTLPPGTMIRESPTRRSEGETFIRSISGGYMISSFFDVFTEISLNGGGSWDTSMGTTRIQLDYKLIGYITGTKWNDRNGNGEIDDGEEGLSGWIITATDSATGGVLYDTTDESGNYEFSLLPGTYYVSEVSQSGWVQTGGEPIYTIHLGLLETADSINFGNAEVSKICVRKYFDWNHNQELDPGEEPMANILFTLNSNEVHLEAMTDDSGDVCFENLLPGNYVLNEVLPSGYSVSVPKEGVINLLVLGGTDTSFIWLNGAAADVQAFRTASYEDWATAVDGKGKAKAVKCKPDKVEFKFQITAPKAASGVVVKIGQSSSGSITDATKSVTYATWTDAKEVTYTGSIDSLQVLQVEGWGTKGKAIKASLVWQTSPKVTKVKVTSYLLNNPRLPMPNLYNVLSDLQTQGALPFTIGASSGAGSFLFDKDKTVIKSLASKGTLHTGNLSGCITTADGGKELKKQLKGLIPGKVTSRVGAEVLTFKLNLLASEKAKFPVGLGSLIYVDESSPYNGLTLDSLAVLADMVLQCGQDSAFLAWTQDSTGSILYNLLALLDSTFRGEIDTTIWSCGKLELSGVKLLKNVPYLRANPTAVPERRSPEPIVYNVPTQYTLQQNYPNPFNPMTTIAYDLVDDAIVTLKIYNILGQEIATLIDNELVEAGENEIDFDAAGLPSGVYFYRLTVQPLDEDGVAGVTLTQVKKMMLLK